MHRTEGGTVKITNKGAQLSPATLKMGGGQKRAEARGGFHEGYKLAALVACRQSLDFSVRTPTQIWTFALDYSEAFQSVALVVTTRNASHFDGVEFRVGPISEEDWAEAQARVLPPNSGVYTPHGRLLTDPEHEGKLFVKDLFVCRLKDSLFGYNLDLPINRDRNVADPNEVEPAIVRVLNSPEVRPHIAEHVSALLTNTQAYEAKAVARWNYLLTPESTILAAITAVWGDNDLPVTSDAEAAQALSHGLQPRFCDAQTQQLVARVKGPNSVRLKARNLTPRVVYNDSMLSQAEHANLVWAETVVELARDTCPPILIVDFWDSTVLGRASLSSESEGICLARCLLSNRAQLMSILIHELAHLVSGAEDGTSAHRASLEELAGQIIAKLC